MDLPLVEGVSKAGNSWKKKEWVLETLGEYPRKVKFDFFGDRVDQNPLEVGKCYRISFDIESRDWNGRWYTDIRAFRSEPMADQSAAGPMAFEPEMPAQPGAGYGAAPQSPGFISGKGDEGDDLPF